MQNSALAAVLAGHLPHPALSAMPGCISATVHSLIGSLLAAWWRRGDRRGGGYKGYSPAGVLGRAS